jgi:large subunit ribosomal protein L5
MATVREGARMASSLGRRQIPLRASPLCARRYASTGAEKSLSDLADLDNASSFATGTPDQAAIEAFNAREKAKGTVNKLPGNRFVAQSLYMTEHVLNSFL